MVWSGVYPPTPRQPCDLCKSETDVNSVMVEVNQNGCVKSLFSHIQSNLCKKCKDAGWFVQYRCPRLTYSNRNTQESRWK